MKYAEVILPIPLHQTFTYEVPNPLSKLSPGQRLLVPIGRRVEVGFVLHTHNQTPRFKTRPIQAPLDREPLFSATYMRWLHWAHEYYLAPLGEVLLTALPTLLHQDLSYDVLSQKKTRAPADRGHWQEGKLYPLSPQQDTVYQALISAGAPLKPNLLYGITGSGKTEIYLHWAQWLVDQQRQVLILVPEIGLTPQMVGRFQGWFGGDVAILHSGLTDNQRFIEWNRARLGRASIVIGTRSAVFTPMPRLGAIIIDEEHDSSYKQEDRFRYHARDLAIMRTSLEKIPVLLASATPSLESYAHAKSGKYGLFTLPERAGGAQRPKIHIIDMKAQQRQRNSPLLLCSELQKAMAINLERREQTILLLNRRGFARSLFCFQCEQALGCTNCSVNMIYHKACARLVCHYCNAQIPLPKHCPSCGAPKLTLLGSGTQTLEAELSGLFPQARITRLDRDTTRKPGTMLSILNGMREHRIDILIGTQMLAKGHDLPLVTLVGAIGMDAGLGAPDFRAAERVFQMMTQVSGRSGRGTLPGRVIIQTHTPSHYSLLFAQRGNFEGFAEHELKFRGELGYPPCGRCIQILFQARNEAKLKRLMVALSQRIATLSLPARTSLLGPSPAPLERLKQAYRYQLLIKAKNSRSAHEVARQLIEIIEQEDSGGIKWSVDVDPLSML